MSWVAVAVGSAAVIGAVVSSVDTSNADKTQAAAATNANNLQSMEFNQIQANEAPGMAAGNNALSQLEAGAGQQQWNASDFQEDPGYQFDLAQGQQAIQRSAAASGQLMSGGTLKALSNYSQNQASNEYQNAYNRFTQNQTNTFNRLSTIAGLGQSASAQTNSAGMNSANQMGANTIGAGNAAAAEEMAQGQILSGGLTNTTNTLANMSMQQKYLNAYTGNGLNTPGYSMPQMAPQYGGNPGGPSLSSLGNTSSGYWSQNPYAAPASE